MRGEILLSIKIKKFMEELQEGMNSKDALSIRADRAKEFENKQK